MVKIKPLILCTGKMICEVSGLRSSSFYDNIMRRIPSNSPAFTDFPSQTARELQPTSIEAIRQSPDSHVLIFGIPKSGNVWLMNILRDIFGLEQRVTFTHGGLTQQRFDPNLIRAVTIVRDLRDVICSYYRFTKRNGKRDNTSSYFDSIEEFYYKYFFMLLENKYNNVNLSVPSSVAVYGAPVVKYEDLLNNGVDELMKLFNQWQITDINYETIESVVNKYKLTDKVQPKYRETEWIKSDHAVFVDNKGYSDVMSENLIRHIEKHFGEHLQRWGYSLNYS